MATDLNTLDYKTQAVMNKSRLDKYLLVLNLPHAFRNIQTMDMSKRAADLINLARLEYSIYGSPVPSVSVPHIDLPYAGQVAKVSSMARPSWGPLTVNFTVDSTYTNYWVLWKWLDLLNSAKEGSYNPPPFEQANTKKIVGTLKDYATNISIHGMAEFNQSVIRFDYTGCFITELSPIGYNYRVTDELSATFTLQFSQMEIALLDFDQG